MPSKKPNYHQLISSVDPNLLKSWEKEQATLKASFDDKNHLTKGFELVAGCDITFSQLFPDFALSTICVVDKGLKVKLIKSTISKIDVPYVPGFLAFREAPELIRLFNKVDKIVKDELNGQIDCVFVDGNGVLHPKECGLATHLGTILKVPTIGCAKNIFAIDGINSNKINEIKENFKNSYHKQKNIRVPLKGTSGRLWGMAMKNSEDAWDPLIVSIGNMIDIDTAADMVTHFSKRRVVEPIRVSDKHSRKLIKKFDCEYPQLKSSGKNDGEVLAEFQNLIDQELDVLI